MLELLQVIVQRISTVIETENFTCVKLYVTEKKSEKSV